MADDPIKDTVLEDLITYSDLVSYSPPRFTVEMPTLSAVRRRYTAPRPSTAFPHRWSCLTPTGKFANASSNYCSEFEFTWVAEEDTTSVGSSRESTAKYSTLPAIHTYGQRL